MENTEGVLILLWHSKKEKGLNGLIDFFQEKLKIFLEKNQSIRKKTSLKHAFLRSKNSEQIYQSESGFGIFYLRSQLPPSSDGGKRIGKINHSNPPSEDEGN